ncbi:MAG: 16S rRNA (adenine(1518)-N(6)/adenine(1519)-N(6))-dimethyltransferase RsmA [Victivallales bacterium]|jgi:16S rRNA (adenine1518-N6/adenine1519-N6)-dimethyltransferase|nr:16S rRNA (adenine(1518)-N(6)/adenine(1519)-N(6))-dimethyltransferase RsmA [Victivallales bacterium]
MNKQQLTAALESIGMRPGRGLGQNFLLDANMLDYIVRLSDPKKGEEILEVGPGFGALTSRLLKSGAEVYAIEFDHRIAEYLRTHIDKENFHLTEADACRVNYRELLGNRPFRAIANLPYSISTIFIARMLELPNPPQAMFFMLQREMGERLSAVPGTKNYGALSVRTQLRYEVKLEKIVPPTVFFPPPEVDSAIVSFRRHDRYENDPELCRLLPGVVKTVFAQRRKQMGKVLRQNYGEAKAEAALKAVNLSPEIRPDRLTVDQFATLTRSLFEFQHNL